MPKDILIVEDDSVTSRYLELGLKRLGYETIRVAVSAESAIEAVKARAPDLVLMDIQLDGARDGIETARILKAEFAVPVIFLTGLSDEVTVARAKVVDPLGYLVKPVKAEELRSTMTVALQKHRLQIHMKAREAAMLAAFDSAKLLVLIADDQGVITYSNKLSTELLANESRTLLGAKLADVLKLRDSAERALDVELNRAVAYEGTTLLVATGPVEASVAVTPISHDLDEPNGVLVCIRVLGQGGADAADVRRLSKEVESLATVDSLTGVATARGFSVHAEHQLHLARRLRADMQLCVIDICGLDDIEIEYGVTARHQALIDTVSLLRGVFPDGDLCGRVGANQFAVLTLAPKHAKAELAAAIGAGCAAQNAAGGRAFTLRLAVASVPITSKEILSVPQLLARARTRSIAGNASPPSEKTRRSAR